MTTERMGFGCKIEAELIRDGKVVPDKPKPEKKYMAIQHSDGIAVIELIPKEKTNVKD